MEYSRQGSISRRHFCLCCVAATTYAATDGWLTPHQAWPHSIGAKIIAQNNTRKHLSSVQRVDDWDFLPLPAGALPSEVFSKEHKLKLNGASIGLQYYGPAHTDGDISVTFAEANVVHVADTFWNGIYPFIVYSTGGSINGVIAACDASLAAVTTAPSSSPATASPPESSAARGFCTSSCRQPELSRPHFRS